MKKINYLKFALMALVAVFILTAIPQNAYAQLSKKNEKQLSKAKENEYKNAIKLFKKEGWKLSGSSSTLEVALLEHYAKKNENNKELVGEVSQCKSIGVCKQFALTTAQNRYASMASGSVKGRIESLLRADDNLPEIEINKILGAYENQVKAEISGVLTESFSLIKDNGQTKEYRTYFLVNEEKAGAARARAMERSLRETKISIIEAEEISAFVREGFKIE